MMRNLGWESYMPVIEYSIQTNNLLDSLIDLSDGRICPVGKPNVLPKSENGYSNVYKEIIGSKIVYLIFNSTDISKMYCRS